MTCKREIYSLRELASVQAALQQQRRAVQEACARSAALEIRAAEAQRGFADRAVAADARFEELLRQAQCNIQAHITFWTISWLDNNGPVDRNKPNSLKIFQTGTPKFACFKALQWRTGSCSGHNCTVFCILRGFMFV